MSRRFASDLLQWSNVTEEPAKLRCPGCKRDRPAGELGKLPRLVAGLFGAIYLQSFEEMKMSYGRRCFWSQTIGVISLITLMLFAATMRLMD